jgi:hypothetical protein
MLERMGVEQQHRSAASGAVLGGTLGAATILYPIRS